MSVYGVRKQFHEKTYGGVVGFLTPLEGFLCNSAYPTLFDLVGDTSSYIGDGIVPAKIPMGGGYDFSFTLHEYSHMIEFAMCEKPYRIGRHGFGFSFPKDSFGYDCPTKSVGIQRELKTVAIMGRILYQFRKELGMRLHHIISMMIYDVDAICSFVSDSFLMEYDNTFWGGIDRHELPYNERKKAFVRQAFRYTLLQAGNISWDDIELANKRVKKFVVDKYKRQAQR